MTADRDDLAALLAEYGIDPEDVLDLATVVLESDWLRGVKAGVWDEGRDVGHEDTYLNLIEGRGDFDAAETPNPYRADRVEDEDGGGE